MSTHMQRLGNKWLAIVVLVVSLALGVMVGAPRGSQAGIAGGGGTGGGKDTPYHSIATGPIGHGGAPIALIGANR